MIIVHGTIPIRPDCRERALELARAMAQATQAEPGCLSYDFYVGLSDASTLMLFQEWEDMDALMKHFQTPHMETFLQALPSVVSGEIVTRRYLVQRVSDEAEDSAEPTPIIH
jgi:quinol monooxygenase YgiN